MNALLLRYRFRLLFFSTVLFTAILGLPSSTKPRVLGSPPAAGAGRDEHPAQTQSAGLPDGLLRPVQPWPCTPLRTSAVPTPACRPACCAG
ncbi:hypothetical protein P4114_02475 [Pseudomonas aeruginosa]|nr:hypothetical protein [Pseudomonas aeruginosa]